MRIRIEPGKFRKSLYYDQPLQSSGLSHDSSMALGYGYKIDGFDLVSLETLGERTPLIADGDFEILDGTNVYTGYQYWIAENSGGMSGGLCQIYTDNKRGIRLYYTGTAGTAAQRVTVRSSATIPAGSHIDIQFRARGKEEGTRLRVGLWDGSSITTIKYNNKEDYYPLTKKWGTYNVSAVTPTTANCSLIFALYDQAGNVTPVEADVDSAYVFSKLNDTSGLNLVLGPGKFMSRGVGVEIKSKTSLHIPSMAHHKSLASGAAVYAWTDTNLAQGDVYIDYGPHESHTIIPKNRNLTLNGGFEQNNDVDEFSGWDFYIENPANLDTSTLEVVAGNGSVSSAKLTRTYTGGTDPETERVSLTTIRTDEERNIPPGKRILVTFDAKASTNGVLLEASFNGPSAEQKILTGQSLSTSWVTYTKTVLNTPNQGGVNPNSYLEFYMLGDSGESIFIDNVEVVMDPDVEYEDRVSSITQEKAVLGYVYFPQQVVNHVDNGFFTDWAGEYPDGWDIFEGGTSSVTRTEALTDPIGTYARLTYGSAAPNTFADRAGVGQGYTGNGLFPASKDVMIEFLARASSAARTLTIYYGDGTTNTSTDLTVGTSWTRLYKKITTVGSGNNGINFFFYKNSSGDWIEIGDILVYPIELNMDGSSNVRKPKWLPAPSGNFDSFLTPERSLHVMSRVAPLGVHTGSGETYISSLFNKNKPDVAIRTFTETGVVDNMTLGWEVFSDVPLNNGGVPQMLFVGGKLMRQGLDYHLDNPGRAILWAKEIALAPLSYESVVQPFFTGSFGVTQSQYLTGSVDALSSDQFLFSHDFPVYSTSSNAFQLSQNVIGGVQDGTTKLIVFTDGYVLNPDRYSFDTDSGCVVIDPVLQNLAGYITNSPILTQYNDRTAAETASVVTIFGIQNARLFENNIQGHAEFRTGSTSYSTIENIGYGYNNNLQIWSDGSLTYPDKVGAACWTMSAVLLRTGSHTPQLYSYQTASDRFELTTYPLRTYSRPAMWPEVPVAPSLMTTYSRQVSALYFDGPGASDVKYRLIHLPYAFGDLGDVNPSPTNYDGITSAIYNDDSPYAFSNTLWQGAETPPLSIKPTPRHYDSLTDAYEFAGASKIFNGNYFLTIESLMGFGPLNENDHIYPGYEDVPEDGQHPHKEQSVFGVMSLKVDLLSDVPERFGDTVLSGVNLAQVSEGGSYPFAKEALNSSGESFRDEDTGLHTVTATGTQYFSSDNPLISYASLDSMMTMWADALGLYTVDSSGHRQPMRDAGVVYDTDGVVVQSFGAHLSAFARGLFGITVTDSVVAVVEKLLGYEETVGATFGYGNGMIWGSCAFNLESGTFDTKPMSPYKYPRGGEAPYTEEGRLRSGGVYREYKDDFGYERNNYSQNSPHWSKAPGGATKVDEGWCKIPASGDPKISDILSRNRFDPLYRFSQDHAWYGFYKPAHSKPFDYGYYAGNVGFIRPNKDVDEDGETYVSHQYISDPWSTPYAQANRGTGIVEFSYFGDSGYPNSPGVYNYKHGVAVYTHRKATRNNIICLMNPLRELRGSLLTKWTEDKNSSFHSTDYYYHWGETESESEAEEAHPKCVEYFEYQDGELTVRPYVNYSHFVEPVSFFVIGPARGSKARYAGHAEGAVGQRDENFYATRVTNTINAVRES